MKITAYKAEQYLAELPRLERMYGDAWYRWRTRRLETPPAEPTVLPEGRAQEIRGAIDGFDEEQPASGTE